MWSKFVGFLAAALGFAVAQTALAADMPIKAPMVKAPVVVPYSWTGFYVGGHIGYGWTSAHESLAAGPATPLVGILLSTCGLANVAGTCPYNLDGYFGGGQIGYNWQVSNWVFGLEASFAGASIDGSFTHPAGDIYATKIRSLLLATARIGYAWDRLLAYVKGGYAGGEVKFTQLLPVVGDNLSTSKWHSGWDIGAGLELAFASNWIAGIEYNYVDLGNKGHPVVGPISGAADVVNVDVKGMHTVTGRLSYKFGGP